MVGGFADWLAELMKVTQDSVSVMEEAGREQADLSTNDSLFTLEANIFFISTLESLRFLSG